MLSNGPGLSGPALDLTMRIVPPLCPCHPKARTVGVRSGEMLGARLMLYLPAEDGHVDYGLK